MKTYTMSYRYSRNGTSWTSASSSVKADSSQSAMQQIKSKYPYVKDIRIMSVR